MPPLKGNILQFQFQIPTPISKTKGSVRFKLNQNWRKKKKMLSSGRLLFPSRFSSSLSRCLLSRQQEERLSTPFISLQRGKKGSIVPVPAQAPSSAPSPKFKDGHAVFWDVVEV